MLIGSYSSSVKGSNLQINIIEMIYLGTKATGKQTIFGISNTYLALQSRMKCNRGDKTQRVPITRNGSARPTLKNNNLTLTGCIYVSLALLSKHLSEWAMMALTFPAADAVA